jgi:broad specificity phosphatase PhoE
MPARVLYYIRHGETDWNALGRLQGQRDVPINARGRAQARDCAEILRDLFGLDRRALADLDFIASPLGRARTTMELMRAALGLDPGAYRIEPRLTEVGFGEWEGLTYPEIAAHAPDAFAARERDKWNFVPPKGESYAAMSQRVAEWYVSLSADTVAVAHGGTLRGLIVRLGIMPPEQAPYADIGQGVVYRIAEGSMARYA